MKRKSSEISYFKESKSHCIDTNLANWVLFFAVRQSKNILFAILVKLLSISTGLIFIAQSFAYKKKHERVSYNICVVF